MTIILNSVLTLNKNHVVKSRSLFLRVLKDKGSKPRSFGHISNTFQIRLYDYTPFKYDYT